MMAAAPPASRCEALAAAVRRRCTAGRFADGLALLDRFSPVAANIELRALRRLCLARLGRTAQAATVADSIAADSSDPEDWFRCAQLLNRTGRHADALRWALRALLIQPFNPRVVEQVAHAALADPACAVATMDALAPLTTAGADPTVRGQGRLLVPQRLPHYAPFDGDHHAHMGLIAGLQSLGVDIIDPAEWRGAYGLADALPMAMASCREIIASHAGIDPAHAAEYVANRLASVLVPQGVWPLEFVTAVPMTLGQRPWVLWFDILPTLFSPFIPLESASIDDRSPWYWITRHVLESPGCRTIFSHYPRSRGQIAEFFHSREIANKTIHVNSCDRSNAMVRPIREPAKSKPRITLLFSCSRSQSDSGFYYRGGVDVLLAFQRLAERFPSVELVLRSPLPDTLAGPLKRLARTHPRITWIPHFLEEQRHHDLLATSDIFMMPGAVLYRNGIMEALRMGIVPVLGDPPGVDEIVEHGKNAIVVRGRGHRMAIDPWTSRLHVDLLSMQRASAASADPDFFEQFVTALDALISDPDRLDAMRAPVPETPFMSGHDRLVFERAIAQAMTSPG